jgi:type I restriction enzyme, S subunit
MSKENKLLPELRFPAFKKVGNWQLTTIGEIGSFYYGKSAPKWSLSSDAPTLCVRYGELYTKFGAIISEITSRTNIEPSNLKFSKGGEILVPRVGEVPQDFAKNCCYLPFPNIAIGEMISVYETKEYAIFYAYYFRTLIKQFAEVVEGQNVKNLYYVNLEPIVIGKPSYKEQQKIASCLSSLDEVIAAHSQKLELLKNHKKGLMQNLFPQEGETVPKFRFKEFEMDGEWIFEQFDKVYSFLVTNSFSREQLNYAEGDVKNIHYGDIHTKFSALFDITKETVPYVNSDESIERIRQECYCREGDVIFADASEDLNDVGKSIEIVNVNNEKLLSGLHTLLARQIGQKIVLGFSGHLFFSNRIRNQIRREAQGAKVLGISGTRISKITVCYPKNHKEQQTITSCLSSLDVLIKAQAEKLGQLKVHKKGLMQGLFPKVNGQV